MGNIKHDHDAATAAIEFESLTKVYAKGATQVRAVDGISLSIPPGQILGLLGPNGAGKEEHLLQVRPGIAVFNLGESTRRQGSPGRY